MSIIKWLPEAKEDLKKLDGSIRKRVFKAIKKIEIDPISYGKPLGARIGAKLDGFYKIEPADGYRLVYKYSDECQLVIISVVGMRVNKTVYKAAASRIGAVRELIDAEMKEIGEIIKQHNTPKP